MPIGVIPFCSPKHIPNCIMTIVTFVIGGSSKTAKDCMKEAGDNTIYSASGSCDVARAYVVACC